jgi:hypothetical protein
MALHNILPLNVRRHRFGMAANPNCTVCGEVEDILHFFTACIRVEEVWSFLATRAAIALGGPVSDRNLVFLAWPVSQVDLHLTLAICTYMAWVWEERDRAGNLPIDEWVARLATCTVGHFRSIIN